MQTLSAIIQRDVKVFCCHTNDDEIYFAQMIAKSKISLMLLLFVARRPSQQHAQKKFMLFMCSINSEIHTGEKERRKGCILDKHTLLLAAIINLEIV